MPGIELDVDLGPIELIGKLGVELDRMNSNYEAQLAQHRKREYERSRMPADVRQFTSGSSAVAATVPFALQLDGPQAGYYWLLRRLVVGGVTWATTAAGTGEVYVTGLTSAAGNGGNGYGSISSIASLSDLVDQCGTGLPFKSFYSNRQVIVQSGENLTVVIRTGTNSQTYVAAAQFEVHRTLSGAGEFEV